MPTITKKAAAAESASVNAPENETTVPAKQKAASSGNAKHTAGKASPTSASQTTAPKSKKKEKGGSVTLLGGDYQAFLKFQQGQDQSNSPAQQKIAEKERKAQENLAIQECNRAMRDKEDHSDDDTEDNTPPAKKSKPSHTILSDDEAELSKELGSTMTVPGLPDLLMEAFRMVKTIPTTRKKLKSRSKMVKDLPTESQASAAGDALADNGMEISTPALEKAYQKPSSKNSSAPKLEHASVSPSLSSTKTEVSSASTAKKAVPPKSSGGTKVICFGNWKLDSDPEKPDWIWTIIAETPSALGVSSRPRATEGLKQLLNDNAEKEKVMTYVRWLREDHSLNTIVTKAHSKVAGYLSLHGSVQDVMDKVTWLLQASNFLYRDLNVKERTFNSSKPFGNPFIKDLIQTVWFNTSKNSSKAEAMTTKKIDSKQRSSIDNYSSGSHCGSINFFSGSIVQELYLLPNSVKILYGIGARSCSYEDDSQLMDCFRFMHHSTAVYKSIILTCGDLSYLLMEEEEVNEEEIKDVKPEDLDSIADNGMAEVF
ncbi:hypothetical protein CPB84DRAFT_1855768 [Gymnopilus junonius]|uniref:DUF6532 domain-containing protein n=1 Tax=Gymnopilus junonius TaxID=109634 RepID=A0A9P5N888_GYMJU|nr:hypothetical protein CPB84DRAFT_1855768 [Gymnopilus junonius]